LCYMLSIFILEIIFDKHVPDIQNNLDNMKFLLFDLLSQNYISNELKNLIKNSIEVGMQYQDYKEIVQKKMQEYNWDDFTIPNMYNLYYSKEGYY